MTENTTPGEDRLIEILRAGLTAADPVPTDVAEFAKAAWEWRDVDAILAQLDFDSAEEDLPTGVRSTATTRMISFQAGQWLIDIEYDPSSGRLLGQIDPSSQFDFELHTSGARFSDRSDEQGRFRADSVPSGPMAIVLRFQSGDVVKTEWIVL